MFCNSVILSENKKGGGPWGQINSCFCPITAPVLGLVKAARLEAIYPPNTELKLVVFIKTAADFEGKEYLEFKQHKHTTSKGVKIKN